MNKIVKKATFKEIYLMGSDIKISILKQRLSDVVLKYDKYLAMQRVWEHLKKVFDLGGTKIGTIDKIKNKYLLKFDEYWINFDAYIDTENWECEIKNINLFINYQNDFWKISQNLESFVTPLMF